MKFYEFKGHPAAVTQGRGMLWWRPRSEWVEVPAPSLVKHATELSSSDWLARFRFSWGVTREEVEEASTTFGFRDVIRRVASGFASREPALAMARALQRSGEKRNDPQLVKLGANLEKLWT